MPENDLITLIHSLGLHHHHHACIIDPSSATPYELRGVCNSSGSIDRPRCSVAAGLMEDEKPISTHQGQFPEPAQRKPSSHL